MRKFLSLSAALVLVSMISASVPALAERSDVTIKGPGIEMRQKKGWFGSGKTEYKDALGNSYSTNKGWFGRQTTEGNLFGSKIKRSGDNVAVTGPNGKTMIKQSRHWWSGKRTEIDGNGIVNELRNFWHNNP